MSKEKQSNKESSNNQKKVYQKPTIETEELLTFGALCNGTSTGGRKASTEAPSNCGSRKLTS